MRIRRTVLALGLGIAVVVGGCGGGTATTAPATPAASHAAVPGVGSMIPADDGYETFDVFGLAGAQAVATVTTVSPADVQAVMTANGKTDADFSYAIGTGSKGTIVKAIQIKGLTASYFSSIVPQANSGTTKHDKVGGKDVLASEAAGTGQWVYMPDDMIFVITGTKDAAAALLKQLP